ncbi:C40 family peptidase [Dermabacteraceae bacterium P13115]
MSSNAKGGTGLVVAVSALLSLLIAIPIFLILLAGGGAGEASRNQCLSGAGGPALAVQANGSALPQVPGYTPEQMHVAAVIMQVAKDNNLNEKAQLIGIMTALQESTLMGDPTSSKPDANHDAGPFQQRILPGWYGPLEKVNDPAYAAHAFFFGVTASHPTDWGSAGGRKGFGHLPGLVDIPHWETLTPNDAAQKVQGSAFPNAYAKREPEARRIMAALSGVNVDTSQNCATAVANGPLGTVIAKAQSWIGLPYIFGAGNANGPTRGGFDCSGFTLASWSSIGASLPRTAQQQYDYLASTPVSKDDLQPGDLIFYSYGRLGPNGVDHVAMVLNSEQQIEASQGAKQVKVGPLRVSGRGFVGIRRVPRVETSAKAAN